MPSLAEIVEASRAATGGSRTYTNKDLTPAGRRQSAGVIDEAAAIAPQDFGRGGHVPQNAPGESERDRLVRESKDTLTRVDPFAKMIEGAGNRAAMDSLAQDPSTAATNAFVKHVGTGIRAIPSMGSVKAGWEGIKGAVKMPFQGYGELAHLADAVQSDPGLLTELGSDEGRTRLLAAAGKNTASDVGSMMDSLANDPEAGGHLVGGALLGSAAPDALAGVLKSGPGVVGRGLSATGRGLSKVGNSKAATAAGKYAGPTAVFGHPALAAAEIAVPPALRGLGGALQRGGAALESMDLPGALSDLGNTRIPNPFEHVITPDEQAAASVRATVDTAKRGVASGQSRAQADQRAGWPLGQSSATKHTTPGADVKAHWPYEPASRGKGGNSTPGFEGRNSPKPNIPPALSALDDLAGPSSQMKQQKGDLMDEYQASVDGPAKPFDMDGQHYADDGTGSHTVVNPSDTRPPGTYHAQDVLDQPGSQAFMNNEHAANKPIADARQARSQAEETDRLLGALHAHQAAGDAAFDSHLTGPEVDMSHELAGLSDLDRASRVSRARAQARAAGGNTAFAPGY